MRTRIVVAFAALMAASALVAVPAPAGSRVTEPRPAARSGAARAVSIALAAGSRRRRRPSKTHCGGLHLDRSGRRFGIRRAGTGRRRDRAARRPRSRRRRGASIKKNYWRFDPNISWYGPGLYGNGTACGQKLTKELVGVAHRTLPCGTMVTFRYNGKTVTAPVIDRGPYVSGRTWDLSKGLCTLLDHCFTGTIEWKLGG